MALLKATTESGVVVGQPSEYQASTIFKGIPYAKPPVGDLRWRAPEKPESWDGDLLAYEYGPIPMQMRSEGFYKKEFYPIDYPMSEDCLYLNVITPAEEPGEKLPVVLWIYGGSFVGGYANKLETDGLAFAKKGIVFVSFNYRIGPLGFLACKALDEEAPTGKSGNYGLKDQIAALDWVHDNIAAFGGDPDHITIMGQSAGAMSVFDLMCSPLARGKFVGAIMDSAGGPVPCMTQEDFATKYCNEFVDSLGVDLDGMRSMDIDELWEKWGSFMAANPPAPLPTQPVHGDDVLPEDLVETWRKAAFADVPVLMGTNANEDQSFVDSPDVHGMRDGFYSGTLALCEKMANACESDAFMYHFAATPPGEPNAGAWHSAEQMYVFQTMLRSYRPYSGVDLDLSNAMNSYWANFIKTGNPNGSAIDGAPLPEWAPFKEKGECIYFDRGIDPHMIPAPEFDGVPRKHIEALG